MSAATSPGTGLAYGLRRVCAAWGVARSSFYAMTSGQHAEQPPAKRRGPKPAISDQALLVAIDLEASPWEGEGYRKVWARLRVCRDIRVARKRVLRLMRENNLLSPHRCRRRGGNLGVRLSYPSLNEISGPKFRANFTNVGRFIVVLCSGIAPENVKSREFG